jgi:hypothetical protein
MRIDVSNEDLEINVYREELTGEVYCQKRRDRRDSANRQSSSRTGGRCYTLSFELKGLRKVEEDEEVEGIRKLVLWKKNRQELLDLLSKAIEAVKKAD